MREAAHCSPSCANRSVDGNVCIMLPKDLRFPKVIRTSNLFFISEGCASAQNVRDHLRTGTGGFIFRELFVFFYYFKFFGENLLSSRGPVPYEILFSLSWPLPIGHADFSRLHVQIISHLKIQTEEPVAEWMTVRNQRVIFIPTSRHQQTVSSLKVHKKKLPS